ncbi:hypothetical protein [Pseudomonas sp. FeS53a]|jgi:hypothetical protein|uniref:hypothetical protein n=1 Tax=Pseudomonas sp. FeS53a TaxID=1604022 RepID=UPI000A473D10|nr:hypothetical protein [Pseudomonas sp. FeS53a]
MCKKIFIDSSGDQILVTANPDHTLSVSIKGGKWTYTSLEKYFLLHISSFQSVWKNLSTYDKSDWSEYMFPAILAMKASYHETALSGTAINFKNTSATINSATGLSTRNTQREFTTNTWHQLDQHAQHINKTQEKINSTLHSAQTISTNALKKNSNDRRKAEKILKTTLEKIKTESDTLERQKEELRERHRILISNNEVWKIAGDQSEIDIAEHKSFRVKIKKGKLREYIFFSRFRHSIPYFLQEHVGEIPPGKHLNTITTLTESQLENSFFHFIENSYLPHLNRKNSGNALKFTEKNVNPNGYPEFHADKYYPDQGMHCTPIATSNVSFTLNSDDYNFLIELLNLVRRPTDEITSKKCKSLIQHINRAIKTNSEIIRLAANYNKFIEAIGYLPKRAANKDDAEILKEYFSLLKNHL